MFSLRRSILTDVRRESNCRILVRSLIVVYMATGPLSVGGESGLSLLFGRSMRCVSLFCRAASLDCSCCSEMGGA